VTAVTTSVKNDLSASALIALVNQVIIRLLLKKARIRLIRPQCLVEAVGIEPTSESLWLQILHACPLSFYHPSRQIKAANQPAWMSFSNVLNLPLKETGWPKIPQSDVLSRSAG